MTESSRELLESLRHYADHDETAPTWLVRAAADEIEQLRAALVHAVEVIQTWHNMGVPRREQSDMWDIYWKNAPEMKPIRAALKSKELSN